MVSMNAVMVNIIGIVESIWVWVYFLLGIHLKEITSVVCFENSQLSKYQLKCSAVTFAVHRFRLMFWHLVSSAWRSTQCTVCTARPDCDTISVPFLFLFCLSFLILLLFSDSFYLFLGRFSHFPHLHSSINTTDFAKSIIFRWIWLLLRTNFVFVSSFAAAVKSMRMQFEVFGHWLLSLLLIVFFIVGVTHAQPQSNAHTNAPRDKLVASKRTIYVYGDGMNATQSAVCISSSAYSSSFFQIDIQLSGINKIVFHSAFITRHSTVNDVENNKRKKIKIRRDATKCFGKNSVNFIFLFYLCEITGQEKKNNKMRPDVRCCLRLALSAHCAHAV